MINRINNVGSFIDPAYVCIVLPRKYQRDNMVHYQISAVICISKTSLSLSLSLSTFIRDQDQVEHEEMLQHVPCRVGTHVYWEMVKLVTLLSRSGECWVFHGFISLVHPQFIPLLSVSNVIPF